MQAKLKINGVDFSPWLKENGLQQTEIVRQGSGIVTMDGMLHQTQIIKRGISAALVELRDVTWYRLMEALRTRPATVEYIDDEKGERSAVFYVTSPTATAKTVRGGITYFSGGTFSLEER